MNTRRRSKRCAMPAAIWTAIDIDEIDTPAYYLV